MKKLVVQLGRWLAGTGVLFLTGALVWALLLLPRPYDVDNMAAPFCIGLGAGLVWFTFVSRLLVFYVFGHELTHWLAAKLFLRETGELKVSTKGGSVAVQKPNVWITLAPYFVPFYTLVWLVVAAIFRFAYGAPPPLAIQTISVGCGLTYAYHVVLTVVSLRQDQADFKACGRYLSVALILFFNALFAGTCLLTIGGLWGAGVNAFLDRVGVQWRGLANLGEWLYEGAIQLVNWTSNWW